MKAVVTLSKTFFPKHPRKGEDTQFRDKVKNGTKIHTCRSNYEYWKAKIAKLKETGGVLSVRQWSANPYRSPQEVVVDIPADIIEVQKLTLWRDQKTQYFQEGIEKPIHTDVDWQAFVDDINVQILLYELATNDGLTIEDYKAWFIPVFDKAKEERLDFAIIHFTKFRY